MLVSQGIDYSPVDINGVGKPLWLFYTRFLIILIDCSTF